MDPLPNGWDLATRTSSNGNDVSGALEIAGDDMQFPSTGALVRAVPLRGDVGPVSVPGDTQWKGAMGKSSFEQLEAPPPDITLECYDGTAEPQELLITWDLTWSDVLDLLNSTFKRACVFQYDWYEEQKKRTIRTTVASEKEFDKFCSRAELIGNKSEVYIINATFTPSEFIREEVQAPMITNGGDDQFAMTAYQGKQFPGMHEEEEEEPVPRLRKRDALLERLQDAPIPITHTIAFGLMGLMISIAAVVLGYLDNLNTLGAVSLALPLNMFVLSFFVSAVEDGVSSLVRLGVGFCGFFCAFIVIVCYSITRELVALGAAFLFLLASFYYLELNVRARGWTSWFQGLKNLFEWMRGGCPLVGIRKQEDVEEIIIIGRSASVRCDGADMCGDNSKEPPMTMATMMLEPDERYPGVKEFKEPKQRMKVRHIGSCFAKLSPKGNPMGPWEEGIIHKKTARQLRKWLMRNGHKTEADFKKWADLPPGEIEYQGPLGTSVRWQNNGIDYYETGENGTCYELVLYEQEQVDAEAEKYKDGARIHSGGSKRVMVQTFLAYFMRKFCAFFWYWVAFLSYFLMLYTFEYSLTNFAVFQAIGGASYNMKGGLYNVGPGNDVTVHIYCKGVTQGVYDGRPPVIMESMEAIGQGIAMARLQDLIAQRGIACVYDRVGFGFSSDMEDTSLWSNRTPDAIVSQLHYALINGTNIKDWRPVTWTRTGKDELNRTVEIHEPVRPPFVMLGHSAGGLYARLFAARYPRETAGLVLVDPLPAENGGIPSIQQEMLSPFLMQLCTRFLQPVGLIYTFFPSVVNSLFSEQTRYNLNNEDSDQPLNDFETMTSRMFERQWCPSVLAEWYGLYSGDNRGIDVVAEADRANYTVPALIWVRDKSRLEGGTSSDPVYKWDGFGPLPAAEVEEEPEPPAENNGTRRSDWETSPAGMRRGHFHGPRRQLLADECDGCMSWEEVQLELLNRFENSWINPFTAQRDIMRGDPASCAAAECTEYTPMENAREIFDAVLDMWNMLLYNDISRGSNWTISLVRREDANSGMVIFDDARFKCDLAVLLRHVGPRAITILPIDFEWDEVTPRHTDTPVDCEDYNPISYPYDGYSGDPDFGVASYQPRNNKGTISFTLQLIGHKDRAVGWAEDNLRGSEDTNLDSSAVERRTTWLHQWQVLEVTETVCNVDETTGVTDCVPARVDLFSSEYSSTAHLNPFSTPQIYKCPQNTYQDGRQCSPCDLERTSRPGSQAVADCFACQPIFDQSMTPPTWRYYYLNCTGVGCAECPNGTLSSAGALGISDCRPISGFTFFIKGPMDAGTTSQAIEPHRNGREPRPVFDVLRFRRIIERITSVSLDRVVVFPGMPRDVPDYPASRCTHLRGGCMFQVGFSTQADSSEALVRATRYMLGLECVHDDHPIDTHPHCYGEDADPKDENRTRIAARTELFETFEIVNIFSQSASGVDSGECPARLVNLTSSRSQVDFFKPDFIQREYTCPNKFYKDPQAPICRPCPDMTTSDAGTEGIGSCLPFDTLVMVGKDASLTYQSRTNPLAGGLAQARPNALRLHDGDISYIKVRGYAIHIDEQIDSEDVDVGYQWSLCPVGLNCFNASDFRNRVSEVVGGGVKPNEVRLLQPYACSTNAPGLSDLPNAPTVDVYTSMCGPWPGFPTTAAEKQCVCSQSNCYVTGGRFMIGTLIGGEVLEPQKAGTAGECAQIARARLTTASFLYDPDTLDCLVRETYSGDRMELCPSTSPECILRACTDIPVCPITPGMQLYWSESNLRPEQQQCTYGASVLPTCTHAMFGTDAMRGYRLKIETDQCSLDVTGEPGGAPERRSSFPLDIFYILMNMHAETATELEAATKVFTEGNPAAAFRTERQRRAGLLDEYQIIRLMKSSDKQPDDAVGRETSLNGLLRTQQTSCAISAGSCMTAFTDDTTFVTMQDGAYLQTGFGNEEGTVLEVMISRIDVTLDSESPDNLPVDLMFEFSDGNTRSFSLSPIRYDAVGVLLRRTLAFYIEPVVTTRVRITPIFHGASMVNVAIVDFFGQEMSQILDARAVNIFQNGYVDGGYKCPSTTSKIGSTTARLCPTGDAKDCSCEPCMFPMISNLTGEGECSCPACGDGRLNWQFSEECDDGNVNELDGCTSTCEVENLQMCEGEKDPVTFVGLPIVMYDNPDSCLRLGSFWTPYGKAGWNSRYGTAAVIHKNAMWIIAGIGDGAKEMYNDVWFEDTNGWNCIAAEPAESCVPADKATDLVWGLGYPQTVKPKISDYFTGDIFAPRGYHGAVSLQGFIWVTGGVERRDWQLGSTEALNCPMIPDGSGRECQLDSSFNDVWRTSGSADAAVDINRVSWELVTQNAAWAARGMHGFLVFKDTMWVIGGRQYVTGPNKQVRTLNDVWSSTDGKDWSVATINPSWRSRAGHGAVVSLDQSNPPREFMYITGGRHDDGSQSHYLNDVWRSEDGITWTQITAHAGWHGRWLHRSIVFQNSMWVIGGQRCGATETSGEWTSDTPCRRTNDASTPPNNYGDVWVSVNQGAHWDEATASAAWNRRAGHALVVFDTSDLEVLNPRENLWILGGMDGFDTAHNDSLTTFAF